MDLSKLNMANSTDNNLLFSYFSQKGWGGGEAGGISCKLSLVGENVVMSKPLFSAENKKNISECCLLINKP